GRCGAWPEAARPPCSPGTWSSAARVASAHPYRPVSPIGRHHPVRPAVLGQGRPVELPAHLRQARSAAAGPARELERVHTDLGGVPVHAGAESVGAEDLLTGGVEVLVSGIAPTVGQALGD